MGLQVAAVIWGACCTEALLAVEVKQGKFLPFLLGKFFLLIF